MKKHYLFILSLLLFFSYSVTLADENKAIGGSELEPQSYNRLSVSAFAYIQTIQMLLKKSGYNPGTIDGLYGNITASALERYQADNGLATNGVPNAETWNHLSRQNPQLQNEASVQEVVNQALERQLSDIEAMLRQSPQTSAIPVAANSSIALNSTQALVDRIINTQQFDAINTAPRKYQPQPGDKKLIVGTIAKRGKEKALKKWGSLLDYLSTNMEGYYFELKPGTLDELAQWGETMHYLLTNPKMFVEFDLKHGFRPVATLRNLRLGKSYDRFGSVIFTRQDRPINSLEEAKGHSIGIVGHAAWGGWILGRHTFYQAGIDPYTEMTVKPLGISQDKIVQAVLDKQIDIGVVRTDTIERMVQEGKISQNDLKLIHENTKYGESFPFWLSSNLYPEWTFAAGRKISEHTNKKVAALLLHLDKSSPVSKVGKNDGWNIPSSYQGVHDVLRDLRIPPYENYGKITMVDVLRKYWALVLSGLIVLAAAVFFSLYFRKLNRRLSHTNTQLLDAQTQLVQSEKMAGIGMMAAGITHEINTPLAYAKSNTEMLRDEIEDTTGLFKQLHTQMAEFNDHLDESGRELLQEAKERLDDTTGSDMLDYVDKGLSNISELVISLKNYSRLDRAEFDVIDVHEGLDSTLLIAKNTIKEKAIVNKHYDDLPKIECRPSQINQVIVNLLTNAVQATEEKKARLPDDEAAIYQGRIDISTHADNDYVYIDLRDNGKGIAKENQKQVFTPMFTTKKHGEGMGMGLTLSEQIISKHHGELSFKSEYMQGTTFRIKLPISQPRKKAA